MTSKRQVPRIISKQYLSKTYYGRSFRWIRKHILTDQALRSRGIDIDKFKRCKDFPPEMAIIVWEIIHEKHF